MDLKSIDINSWTQVGEGGIGKTYVHPDNPAILLKVNRSSMSDERTVKREVETSQHVFGLGLSTPRMFDTVRVGDAYGYTFERIKGKKSLSRICADDSSRISEIAALLASEGRKLHATTCDTAFFPSHKEGALKAIGAADFADEADKQKLLAFVEGLDDAEAARFAAIDVCYISYQDPRPEANQMFGHVVHELVEKYY